MSAAPRRLSTAEEFAALPREGMLLELVRGEIAAMPPAFRDHGNIASKIHIAVGHYIVAHKLGETYTAETGFLLARNPDTIRTPDFAFIAVSRAPDATTPDGWVDVIPDLIIEVVSSGDRMTEVRDKIQM